MSNHTLTDDALQVVLSVADDMEHEASILYPANYVVLDCGVVLEVLGITPETYNAVIRKFESLEPQPPLVHLASKGRTEPNPNDPEYIKRFKTWQGNKTLAIMSALYALGIKVVSVPDNMPGPDSDDWAEEHRLSSLGTTNSAKERFIFWLQGKALSVNKVIAERERNAILLAAIRVMGVAEVDVQEAVKRP